MRSETPDPRQATAPFRTGAVSVENLSQQCVAIMISTQRVVNINQGYLPRDFIRVGSVQNFVVWISIVRRVDWEQTN